MRLTDERVNAAAERASEAFWAAVAAAFPEVKSGDVDPFTSLEWDEQVDRLIRGEMAERREIFDQVKELTTRIRQRAKR